MIGCVCSIDGFLNWEFNMLLYVFTDRLSILSVLALLRTKAFTTVYHGDQTTAPTHRVSAHIFCSTPKCDWKFRKASRKVPAKVLGRVLAWEVSFFFFRGLHLSVENKPSSGEGKVRGRVWGRFFKGCSINFWKKFRGSGKIPGKFPGQSGTFWFH